MSLFLDVIVSNIIILLNFMLPFLDDLFCYNLTLSFLDVVIFAIIVNIFFIIPPSFIFVENETHPFSMSRQCVT